MITLNKEKIDLIIDKYEKGEKITRKNKIFFRGEINTLNNDVVYVYNNEEIKEYALCFNDIYYFIEKYLISSFWQNTKRFIFSL